MSFTIYQASIPIFLRTLGQLSSILAKAAAHAEAQHIDPSVLIDARLAPVLAASKSRAFRIPKPHSRNYKIA